MVKKLLKYEVKYYLRTLLIYEIVLFTLAVFTRILMFFETDSIIYKLLQGSSFLLFALAAGGCSLMASVISIFRFYRNLFTSEGYLTFALPVSTNQHLFAKLLSAFVYNIIVYVSAIAAFLITISGDVLNETINAGLYLIKYVGEIMPSVPITTHLIFYLLEFIITINISTIFSLLLFYTCIAIGQTAKKNRLLLAVAVYFGYMTISEIFSTLISIVLSISVNLKIAEDITLFVTEHPFATIHISFCGSIIISAIICIILYVITNKIMKRKLNLE